MNPFENYFILFVMIERMLYAVSSRTTARQAVEEISELVTQFGV